MCHVNLYMYDVGTHFLWTTLYSYVYTISSTPTQIHTHICTEAIDLFAYPKSQLISHTRTTVIAVLLC